MPHKYQVIHDLVCKEGDRKFNIDHVVVGPTGVFSIEAKNWERADGTHHQICYYGRHYSVQPIVVFLGSYTTKNPKDAPAWVLNEQAAPIFIKNDFRELSHNDGLLAIAQLKQYAAECGKAETAA